MRKKAENFVKIEQTGENLWPKFEILTVWGLCFHIFARAKFDVNRGNVSPLGEQKSILGPLSKNNMAWLRFAQACR